MTDAQLAEWINRLPRHMTERTTKRLWVLLERVATASTYDPGETDLDDEQPCRNVSVDLGDVRLARSLLLR